MRLPCACSSARRTPRVARLRGDRHAARAHVPEPDLLSELMRCQHSAAATSAVSAPISRLVGNGESEQAAFAVMDAAWEGGIARSTPRPSYGAAKASGRSAAGSRRAGRKVCVSRARSSIRCTTETTRGSRPARVPSRCTREPRAARVERLDLLLTHEPDPATPLARPRRVRRAGCGGARRGVRRLERSTART